MTSSRKLALAALTISASLSGACDSGGARPATQAQLRQGLEAAGKIEIQLCATETDSPLDLAVTAAASTLAERTKKTITTRYVESADSSSAPRIVIGLPNDPGVERLLRQLGGSFEGETVSFGVLSLGQEGSLLHVCAEDPDRPGLPIQILTSSARGALRDAVEDLLPQARPGVVLIDKHAPQERRGFGELDRPLPARDTLPQFNVMPGNGRVLMRPLPDVPDARVADYGERAERAVARVVAWTGREPLEKLELLAMSRGANLRQLTLETDLAVSDGIRSRRAVLLAIGLPDDDGAVAARWAAREVLGTPADNWWLDAIAVDAADHWWGRPLEEWGRYLAARELLPSLEEIVSARSVDRFSQHVLAPARALLFRHLRKALGEDKIEAHWRGDDLLRLDAALNAQFLAGLTSSASGAFVHPDPARLLKSGEFLTGVALDSNSRPGGGFDERGLQSSLRSAAGANLNAVSITSFFTESVPPQGAFGGRLPAGRQCLEGDVSILQAARDARRAGMKRVLLQPHLLLSDSAGYSAWLRRTSREHWDEFFDPFDSMLVHYGLLAELCGIDLLCVGSELSTPTGNTGLAEEVLAHYDARWLGAIELARKSFGGGLTYAAAWPGETNNLRFWSQLDYVGVALYPEFAELNRFPPESQALRARFTTFLERIGSFAIEIGRPALIVEFGVRSTSAGLTETAIGTGSLDLFEQERAYDALGQALQGRGTNDQGLRGLFLWKWSKEVRGGGADDRGFTPQNKPAARTLGDFAARAAAEMTRRGKGPDEE